MSKIVDMLTGSLVKQTIKPVTELLKSVLELFKDTKGKYSSKSKSFRFILASKMYPSDVSKALKILVFNSF